VPGSLIPQEQAAAVDEGPAFGRTRVHGFGEGNEPDSHTDKFINDPQEDRKPQAEAVEGSHDQHLAIPVPQSAQASLPGNGGLRISLEELLRVPALPGGEGAQLEELLLDREGQRARTDVDGSRGGSGHEQISAR
jgi:hypothetical protein